MSDETRVPEVVEEPKLDKNRKGLAPKWAQEPRTEVPHLTVEAIQQLADAAQVNGRGPKGERDQLLILTLFDACLRVSEALELTPADIVQTATGFRLRITGKGQKRSEAVISASHVARLQSYILSQEIGKSERIFPITRKRAHQIVKRAFDQSGLAKPQGTGSVHILRHSGAIARLKATGDPRALQEQLRHADAAMTLRYLKTVQREEALRTQEPVELLQ